MKFLITGGLSGLGEGLCKFFPNSRSISRRSGHNICDEKSRKQISELSLEFDVFINNAFDGPPQEEWSDLGQVRLLGEVFDLWQKNKKRGHIVNIGSIASIFPIHEYSSFQTFRIAKVALDEASLACTGAFLNNKVPFKTTLIRLGRLDTPLARSRDTWTGNGISLDYVSQTIRTLVESPGNSCPFQIDMDVNFQYQN